MASPHLQLGRATMGQRYGAPSRWHHSERARLELTAPTLQISLFQEKLMISFPW